MVKMGGFMKKLSIVIVNKNCLSFTKNCISDLKKQNTDDFDLYMIDNNSVEIGTRSFLMSLEGYARDIVINEHNKPLNYIWNEYLQKTRTPYICFLNNDVRIPSNFVSDTIKIFEKDSKIGVVNHATNHPSYLIATPKELKYEIIHEPYKQGWDFSFRREAYNLIPNELLFFCGDDFLYQNLFKNNWKAAFAISSPIIHFQGMTQSVKRNSGRDIREYRKLGYPDSSHLPLCDKYTIVRPARHMREIKEI